MMNARAESAESSVAISEMSAPPMNDAVLERAGGIGKYHRAQRRVRGKGVACCYHLGE
jgi:hypothetical protein